MVATTTVTGTPSTVSPTALRVGALEHDDDLGQRGEPVEHACGLVGRDDHGEVVR